MQLTNIEELKKKALRITEDSQSRHTVTGKIITLDPEWITPGYAKKYTLKNGILSFIDENLHWYVIPFFNGIDIVLENVGYKKAGFYIPYADGYSHPVEGKRKWDNLLREAH